MEYTAFSSCLNSWNRTGNIKLFWNSASTCPHISRPQISWTAHFAIRKPNARTASIKTDTVTCNNKINANDTSEDEIKRKLSPDSSSLKFQSPTLVFRDGIKTFIHNPASKVTLKTSHNKSKINDINDGNVPNNDNNPNSHYLRYKSLDGVLDESDLSDLDEEDDDLDSLSQKLRTKNEHNPKNSSQKTVSNDVVLGDWMYGFDESTTNDFQHRSSRRQNAPSSYTARSDDDDSDYSNDMFTEKQSFGNSSTKIRNSISETDRKESLINQKKYREHFPKSGPLKYQQPQEDQKLLENFSTVYISGQDFINDQNTEKQSSSSSFHDAVSNDHPVNRHDDMKKDVNYHEFKVPSQWAPPTLQHPAKVNRFKKNCFFYLKMLTRKEQIKLIITSNDKHQKVEALGLDKKVVKLWEQIKVDNPGTDKHVYAKGYYTGRLVGARAKQIGCTALWVRKVIARDNDWYHRKLVPCLKGILDEDIQVRFNLQRYVGQSGIVTQIDREKLLQEVWTMAKMGVRIYGLVPTDFDVLEQMWIADDDKPQLAIPNSNKIPKDVSIRYYERRELNEGFTDWHYYD